MQSLTDAAEGGKREGREKGKKGRGEKSSDIDQAARGFLDRFYRFLAIDQPIRPSPNISSPVYSSPDGWPSFHRG